MKIIKTILLIGSGIAAGALLVLNHIGTVALCGGTTTYVPGTCIDRLFNILVLFNPFLPLFLFSLITYFMRDAIVRPWLYFALGWMPLSMVLIYSSPSGGGPTGFGIGGAFQIITKGTVAFSLSALFALISTVIIAVAWWRQHRKV